MPLTYTPLRYPGGKTKIYPLVSKIIEKNGLQDCVYVEAFCGGAGLAIKLLEKGIVSSIVLNDLDPAIYSIWYAILYHTDELVEFIRNVPLNIKEWEHQKSVYKNSLEASFELGKAAFYLNRTNRSGILSAGPIGGVAQKGAYNLGVRFNRVDLISKVELISSHRNQIALYNLDARDFIDNIINKRDSHDEWFAYFDPPYVKKGPCLYKNSLMSEDHLEIAEKILSCKCKWIATYDDDELIKELYKESEYSFINVGYSANKKRSAKEILISGPEVQIGDLIT